MWYVYAYLVDPASSHILVLKIKPCMSQFFHFVYKRLRMAQYNSYDMCEILFMWITVETLQLIRDTQYIKIYIGYVYSCYLISNYNVLTL